MNLANGLLGLGGFNGIGGTQPQLTGLLGQYYNPQDLKKAKLKAGLLNAGIALLSQKPELGQGIGTSLGAALRGGAEGAQQAQADYMNNAMMGYNMDRQAKQDSRSDQEWQMKLDQWKASADEKARLKAIIKTLPPEQQAAALADSDTFFSEYTKHLMKSQFPDPVEPKIVPKGSMLYSNGKWESPPSGSPAANQAIDNPLSVSKDYQGGQGFKRLQEIAPTIKSMVGSLTDKSAMADLDFVYGLAKILDPTSVVRESEAGMVIDSQGIAPSLLGQLNKIATGQQAMNETTRRNLLGVAMRRAKELQAQAEQERGFYSNMLEQNQYDPNTYLQGVTQLPEIPPASPIQTPLTPPMQLRSRTTRSGINYQVSP